LIILFYPHIDCIIDFQASIAVFDGMCRLGFTGSISQKMADQQSLGQLSWDSLKAWL
jgi:hypothetical protein